jgi:hypothetical protein
MATTKKLLETDLYPPIRDYLESNGYKVRSEVINCDITAVKDDELVVVELKLSANVQLLIQATERQRITDSVYVAVPAPRNRRATHWRGIKRILRMLEVGLITVDFGQRSPRVTREFDPLPYSRRKQPKKRHAVIREISERSGEYNIAGSSGRKLMTAYRENAIFIACCLHRHGSLSPARLRAMGTGDKTQSILAHNFYGWFQRVDRGIYEITTPGVSEMSGHPDLVDHYNAILSSLEN